MTADQIVDIAGAAYCRKCVRAQQFAMFSFYTFSFSSTSSLSGTDGAAPGRVTLMADAMEAISMDCSSVLPESRD